MVCVYKGTGAGSAVMVKHWLERNGIQALLRGGLTGLGGEIPVDDARASVWVRREDEERALDAVRAFEGPVLVHPRWACPDCGEDNEPNFGSCWNCGGDRPDLRD